MAYEANRRVETSVRTFAIVEQLSLVESAGVSELARELGISKGIVHNHVSTLRELGYVRKVSEGYRLSPKLLATGVRARSNAPLYRFASEPMRGLADQLEVAAVLAQPAGADCCVVDSHRMPASLDLGVGRVLPMADYLVGLVILVAGDHETAESISPAYDPDRVRDQLETDGYAVGTVTEGEATRCVATPILDESGECHGSLGVVLPKPDEDGEPRRVKEATLSLRNRVEARFERGWDNERSFATEKHSWVG